MLLLALAALSLSRPVTNSKLGLLPFLLLGQHKRIQKKRTRSAVLLRLLLRPPLLLLLLLVVVVELICRCGGMRVGTGRTSK
jgi:hypothetical protein